MLPDPLRRGDSRARAAAPFARTATRSHTMWSAFRSTPTSPAEVATRKTGAWNGRSRRRRRGIRVHRAIPPGVGSFPNPAFTYEQLGSVHGSRKLPGLCVASPALLVDQRSFTSTASLRRSQQTSTRETGSVASDLDGVSGEGFRETRAGGQLAHLQPLTRRQALFHDGFLAVSGFQPEHRAGRCPRLVPAGGGEGHEAERRRDRIGAVR